MFASPVTNHNPWYTYSHYYHGGWINPLAQPHVAPWVKTCSNHLIPPTSQRYGWTFSPPAKGCLENTLKFMDTLPFVMLGIHTALKDDIHLTTAELVYGTTLQIPGTFLTCSDDPLPDPATYVYKLKTFCQQLRPSTPHRPVTHSYVAHMCSFVMTQCGNHNHPMIDHTQWLSAKRNTLL